LSPPGSISTGKDLGLPFEFEAFVFFAWPIALPYYLVKSRGSRGLLLFAVFLVLLVVHPVVADAVRLAVNFSKA
jgi:hypothetical protein